MKDADELIAAHTKNWRLERMAVIDRLVMRLAIYELTRAGVIEHFMGRFDP